MTGFRRNGFGKDVLGEFVGFETFEDVFMELIGVDLFEDLVDYWF